VGEAHQKRLLFCLTYLWRSENIFEVFALPILGNVKNTFLFKINNDWRLESPFKKFGTCQNLSASGTSAKRRAKIGLTIVMVARQFAYTRFHTTFFSSVIVCTGH